MCVQVLNGVPLQITATSVDIRSIGYSIIGTSPWPLPSSLLSIDASSGLLNLTGMEGAGQHVYGGGAARVDGGGAAHVDGAGQL